MGYTRSPLRYPGGKTRLAPFIRSLMEVNGLLGAAYIEPFAGAAGAAWALLFEGSASHVYLNDLDAAVYAFWRSVFDHTDALCRTIRSTPVNMDTWRKQRAILENSSRHSPLRLGFAAFFLNRTNRSGVIRGGVIGGKQQAGKWRLDARYNKQDLVARIERIAAYRNRVSLYNLDAAAFILDVLPDVPTNALVFLDPPYFVRGHDLYRNDYGPKDHSHLATLVKRRVRQPWIVSYDNVPEIRHLYAGQSRRFYQLSYSAAERYVASEVLMFSRDLSIPRNGLPIPGGLRSARSR